MSCCVSGFERASQYEAQAQAIPLAAAHIRESLMAELLPLSGGFFDMGARKSLYPGDFDSPRKRVKLSPFSISPTSVSNAQFARFVADTGYRTLAEAEGWSFVFHLLLSDPARHPHTPEGLPWWRVVDGASWAAPEGPGSDIAGREDHPAVHISWYDADAYCRWAGMALPTEAQWEYAARGGLAHKKFPWGNLLEPEGRHAMNIWQGVFPHENTGADGFVGTAPVRAFQPNGFGLWNMCGNVWEWVADIHDPAPTPVKGTQKDPVGPAQGARRMQRGGSYLCHASYCARYHVHSRMANEPESTTGHAGFRPVAHVPASPQG